VVNLKCQLWDLFYHVGLGLLENFVLNTPSDTRRNEREHVGCRILCLLDQKIQRRNGMKIILEDNTNQVRALECRRTKLLNFCLEQPMGAVPFH
jgi:hypothetical protein